MENKTKNDFNTNFGEFCYDLTMDFYNQFILQNSKPKNNQWTIISSIILQNNNKFKIISFSSGTKSLPNINYISKKFQIFDCHTEILTLRSFHFFLLKLLNFHIDKENKSGIFTEEEYKILSSMFDFYDIFEYIENSKKFKIKNNVHFHLYISEMPCGECSNILYKSTNNKYDFTGSKTLNECLNIQNVSEKEINFRSKSIRSDFKENFLSYSLSCTDKIMLKNILGYQGKFLSILIEPIFMKSIIINTKLTEAEKNIQSFKDCINYNKRKINKENFNVNIPDVFFVNKSDEIIREDKHSLPFSLGWYFPNMIIKVDPVIGLKIGSNVKEINKFDFLRVKISDYDLCLNIFEFLMREKSLFGNYIEKIEKYILKNIHNNKKNEIDYYAIISSLISKKHTKLKKTIEDDNKDVREFLNKKRQILRKNEKKSEK